MLDSLNWITIGVWAGFVVAVLSYVWVFRIGRTLNGTGSLRMNTRMARLRGRFSDQDPMDDVQEALNNALNGPPALGEAPDEDLWIPEVRRSPAPRQPESS